MTKNILTRKAWVMACAALFILPVAFLSSCSDDKEGMGTPQITAVRATDPETADSTFTKASAGQMIAVIGHNLADVVKAYINDQEIGFNSTLNTPTSIILTVPTEENGFVLSSTDSSLKDEIRLETSHGTATYAFKITAPYPQIKLLQARYPRKTGDVLNVYGLNLVDIEKIYFTDIDSEQLDTTATETIGGNHTEVTYEVVSQNHHLNDNETYETESHLKINIPDLSYDTGSFVVETAAGTVYYPFSLYLSAPTITDISTDMPVTGESVTITGTYFVQVDAIKYGDVTLSPEDFEVADSEDQITFTFKKKPSRGNDGKLTVVTGGGEANYPFFDYSCLLTDFSKDEWGNFIDATNNGWGPDATYEAANPTAAPYTGDGIFARINVPQEGTQWWGTMVFFRKDWSGNSFTLPSYDLIPADASTDNVYLAVEVYNNNSDYNNGLFNGYIRYWLPNATENDPVAGTNQYDNGFVWTDYNAGIGSFDQPVLADINGKAPIGYWYRHVLPLSKFGKFAGKTYKDVVESGIHQFRLQSINQGSQAGKIDICLDNVRIYYKK